LDEVQLDIQPKYTVSCFLSPEEDTIQLFLTLSFPVNTVVNVGEYEKRASQATVLLFNEKKEIIFLKYNLNKNRYFAEKQVFKIKNNETYSLQIVTLEGDTLRSSCTIPSPVSDFEVLIDSTNSDGGDFFATYRWQDNAQEDNYYRYVGTKRVPAFNQRVDIDWTDGSQIATQVTTDKGKDGKQVYSNRANLQDNANGFTSTPPNSFIDATLLNIDKNYYLFQQSIEKSKVGNNFEPTPIFSNIQNGLGIFAGCSMKRKVARIR
jgi:hypothetical protein